MNTTNADHFSLLASLVGFAIAIYAILTQPVVVDSKRPTQTKSGPGIQASETAFARLWDDPFAVYSETNNTRMLKPMLQADGDTLFLVVPMKSQQYEEDRESRIRTRYAIQRALIDQGFAAEPGYLLSSLEFVLPWDSPNGEPRPQTEPTSPMIVADPAPASEEKRPRPFAPVQFFTQRPLQARLFKGSNDSGFGSVVVIWLPDVYACQRTAAAQNQYLDILLKALKHSLNCWRASGGVSGNTWEAGSPRPLGVFGAFRLGRARSLPKVSSVCEP
jgi:hypothetical protein